MEWMLESCRYHDKIFKLSCLTLPAYFAERGARNRNPAKNYSSIFIGRDGIVKKPGQPAG